MEQAPVLISSTTLFEGGAGITEILINRPEARNSLNRETIAQLTEAFKVSGSDPKCRCILFGATGTDAFCAGADVNELIHNSTATGRRDFFRSVATLIESIHRCPIPVVARVHGYALAGGCGLVAASDMVMASDDAVFGLPEVAIGLAPMIVLAPIHRTIGRRALAELALTGDRITAARAYEIGLVSRVVSRSNLHAAANQMCLKIAKHSPDAIRRSKEAIFEVSENEYFSLLPQLADKSALLSLSAEAQEGLSAFIERREPSWRKGSDS